MRAPGRDLRRVCDHEHLLALGQPLQALAHRIGHSATHAAIDLVEDQRRGCTLRRKRYLERQDETRHLATRGDAGQRTEWRAGIGGDFELDTVLPMRPHGLRRSLLDPCAEMGV